LPRRSLTVFAFRTPKSSTVVANFPAVNGLRNAYIAKYVENAATTHHAENAHAGARESHRVTAPSRCGSVIDWRC
jgi:hypothetical protein